MAYQHASSSTWPNNKTIFYRFLHTKSDINLSTAPHNAKIMLFCILVPGHRARFVALGKYASLKYYFVDPLQIMGTLVCFK